MDCLKFTISLFKENFEEKFSEYNFLFESNNPENSSNSISDVSNNHGKHCEAYEKKFKKENPKKFDEFLLYRSLLKSSEMSNFLDLFLIKFPENYIIQDEILQTFQACFELEHGKISELEELCKRNKLASEKNLHKNKINARKHEKLTTLQSSLEETEENRQLPRKKRKKEASITGTNISNTLHSNKATSEYMNNVNKNNNNNNNLIDSDYNNNNNTLFPSIQPDDDNSIISIKDDKSLLLNETASNLDNGSVINVSNTNTNPNTNHFSNNNPVTFYNNGNITNSYYSNRLSFGKGNNDNRASSNSSRVEINFKNIREKLRDFKVYNTSSSNNNSFNNNNNYNSNHSILNPPTVLNNKALSSNNATNNVDITTNRTRDKYIFNGKIHEVLSNSTSFYSNYFKLNENERERDKEKEKESNTFNTTIINNYNINNAHNLSNHKKTNSLNEEELISLDCESSNFITNESAKKDSNSININNNNNLNFYQDNSYESNINLINENSSLSIFNKRDSNSRQGCYINSTNKSTNFSNISNNFYNNTSNNNYIKDRSSTSNNKKDSINYKNYKDINFKEKIVLGFNTSSNAITNNNPCGNSYNNNNGNNDSSSNQYKKESYSYYNYNTNNATNNNLILDNKSNSIRTRGSESTNSQATPYINSNSTYTLNENLNKKNSDFSFLNLSNNASNLGAHENNKTANNIGNIINFLNANGNKKNNKSDLNNNSNNYSFNSRGNLLKGSSGFSNVNAPNNLRSSGINGRLNLNIANIQKMRKDKSKRKISKTKPQVIQKLFERLTENLELQNSKLNKIPSNNPSYSLENDYDSNLAVGSDCISAGIDISNDYNNNKNKKQSHNEANNLSGKNIGNNLKKIINDKFYLRKYELTPEKLEKPKFSKRAATTAATMVLDKKITDQILKAEKNTLNAYNINEAGRCESNADFNLEINLEQVKSNNNSNNDCSSGYMNIIKDNKLINSAYKTQPYNVRYTHELSNSNSNSLSNNNNAIINSKKDFFSKKNYNLLITKKDSRSISEEPILRGIKKLEFENDSLNLPDRQKRSKSPFFNRKLLSNFIAENESTDKLNKAKEADQIICCDDNIIQEEKAASDDEILAYNTPTKLTVSAVNLRKKSKDAETINQIFINNSRMNFLNLFKQIKK